MQHGSNPSGTSGSLDEGSPLNFETSPPLPLPCIVTRCIIACLVSWVIRIMSIDLQKKKWVVDSDNEVIGVNLVLLYDDIVQYEKWDDYFSDYENVKRLLPKSKNLHFNKLKWVYSRKSCLEKWPKLSPTILFQVSFPNRVFPTGILTLSGEPSGVKIPGLPQCAIWD